MVTTYEYDAAGRQWATVEHNVPVGNPDGTTTLEDLRTETLYDGLGRAVTVSHLAVVSGASTTLDSTITAYDALGRAIRTTFADGSYIETGYDVFGNKTSASVQLPSSITLTDSNAASYVTVYNYDVAGNLTDVYQPLVPDPKDPTGQTMISPHTQYVYDPATGDELTQIDANGHTTTFHYDPFGRQDGRVLPTISVPAPGGGTTNVTPSESTIYDAFGRIETSTDFDGNLATYTYYPAGEVVDGVMQPAGALEQVVYSNPTDTTKATQTVSYIYDALGHQWITTDASGTTTDTYDDQGHLTEQVTPEGTIHYVYDPATGEHTETYTDSTDTQYHYDVLGRLWQTLVTMLNGQTLVTTLNGQTVAAPLVTTDTYDATGNLETETLPDGEMTTYGYDNLHRLTSLSEVQTGATVFSQSYILNPDGTRQSLQQTQLQPDGTTVVATSTSWIYDADGRLTDEISSSDAAAAESYSNHFTYDLAGNRLTETHTGPGDGPSDVLSYAYNADDQLTSQTFQFSGLTTTFTYDLNGSQLTSTTGGAVTTYTYDVRNKMVGYTASGQTTAYIYDDAGNRVQETTGGVTTYYLTEDANPTGYAQPLETRVSSPTAAPSETYLIGDHVFGQVDHSGSLSYLLTDGHGSTHALTTAAGIVTASYRYDAFGAGLNFTLSLAQTVFLFGGDAVYDPISGLYLHGDGVRGRQGPNFIEEDPRDPFFIPKTDPLSLHLYIYANANPVSYTDISGLSTGTLVETVPVAIALVLLMALTAPKVKVKIDVKPFEPTELNSMRVQLQQDALTASVPIAEYHPITTGEFRAHMMILYAQVDEGLVRFYPRDPARLSALHGAIATLSIRIGRYPPVDVFAKGNFDRVEFGPYRLDAENWADPNGKNLQT